ncbi:condensin subunit ScpA [Clostridium sp. USBA 49]|uniref:segregation/condensation protein A n=1 Tax=Clostridium TaxID=1485 RepID=UPI0009995181|nr:MULTISPECIES: segregation/condensation protein A [Clostridium]SKA76720.1 condensin subunit ScpA [Clostridium sp. USBA 49]
MALNIKVGDFEGPFDLLLHLIKKNQMDIYDIKIYDITNQYIEYINQMKELDLEITSEFILIAATLLEIKSKMLLPKLKEEELSIDEESDPRKELVSKLIEYKKFKYIANYLKDKEESRKIVFTKKPEIIEDKNNKNDNLEILNSLTIIDLYNIYNELIEKYNNKINKENVIERQISLDAYKIEDKIIYLKEKILKHNHLLFSNVVQECKNKIEIVVTFLAMLELIKLKEIKAIQEKNFTEIYLERIYDNE